MMSTWPTWSRTRKGLLENVAHNSKVAILFSDFSKQAIWRFSGEAAIYESGPVRDQVIARVPKVELDRDPKRRGVAVIVCVDKVIGRTGQTIQQRQARAAA